jgi:tRNA(fMet)-specific endonuclease VapC
LENKDVLIDTTVFIEFLRKRNKKSSYLWKLKEAGHNFLASSITIFELYAGAISKRHKEDLNKLLKWVEIITFSTAIAQLSAEIFNELKAKNQLIEFRDIFIAATAIKTNVTLVKLNEKHFTRIKKLKIFDKQNFTKKYGTKD